ncbi:MAG: amidohydrolase family protein [Anaerolineales bacterium]|nr:amidohydrolase family protein [Anaerolineales bacterium]
MSKQAPIALLGGTLIDGSGREPVENGMILINDKRIKQVSPVDRRQLEPAYRVFDLSGKTIMPGMMDLHVHLNMGELDVVVPSAGVEQGLAEPWALRGIKAYAYALRSMEAGFTTLRDVGDMGHVSVSVRNAINAGIVPGPRLLTCGQFLTTTGGHVDLMPLWLQRTDRVTNVADGVDGVLKAVRSQWKMKNDWIKFYATGGLMDPEDKQEFNDDELYALIGEAHSKEMRVCAHCMHAKGTLAAVKAGLDSVEHGTELTEEIVDLMVERGTYLVPTLYGPAAIVSEGQKMGLPETYTKKMQGVIQGHEKSFRLAHERGVKIALGTDAGFNAILHGGSAHELEALVRWGMTPMEAIVTATASSAALLGKDDQLGTIETGKLADIVVVDGNPLDDIRILQNKEAISLVLKDGVVQVNRPRP